MGGKRTTKEELAQLEALTKEGLTVKEIAQKLGRTPTAIRNLRHKKKLVIKAKGEITTLEQKITALRLTILLLQTQKDALTREVDGLKKEADSLKKEKEKLEAALKPKLTDWSVEINKFFQPKNPQ